MSTETPKPGVYYDVPFTDYLRWQAVSQSMLKPYAVSARTGRYNELHPKEATKSQVLGDAADAAVFHPSRFDAEYVSRPDFPGHHNSNAYKSAVAEWDAMHTESVIMTADEHASAVAIRDAIREHDLARHVIFESAGKSQVSIVWRDEKTGLLCKGRPDRICMLAHEEIAGAACVDLKSSKSPLPGRVRFDREIWTYDYAFQQAFYRMGLNTVASPTERHAVIVAVGNVEPYEVAVHALPESYMEAAARSVRMMLDQYADWKSRQQWPFGCEHLNIVECPKWYGMDSKDYQMEEE